MQASSPPPYPGTHRTPPHFLLSSPVKLDGNTTITTTSKTIIIVSIIGVLSADLILNILIESSKRHHDMDSGSLIFLDEETESQRAEVTQQGRHSRRVAERGPAPDDAPDSRVLVPTRSGPLLRPPQEAVTRVQRARV